MTKFLALTISQNNDQPAYVQIYRQIREMILTGRLAANARLPPTRSLAVDLGFSRSTIVAAYDQLESEGYVHARVGSGIFVTSLPPDHLLHVRDPHAIQKTSSPVDGGKSERAHVPFEIDGAVFDLFPVEDWTRHLAASWRRGHPDLLSFQDPFGHFPLRTAIAEHLLLWRGIDCGQDQIVITSGASDALDLIFRTLAQAGDEIWMEDPGFDLIRNCINFNSMKAVAVPLDKDGFNFGLAKSIAPNGKIAIVTPSRQFPLGITMTFTRRLELLDWAHHSGGWIVEDDYDSEYRYEGRPIPAMAGIDEHGNTLYLGSFSKVMFRSLRLGYLVIPSRLVARFRDVLSRQLTKASFVAQPALADFMTSGAFGAHIRKTRRVYAKRLAALQNALADHAKGLLVAPQQSSGIHLIADIDGDISSQISDTDIDLAANENGIQVNSLSDYYVSQIKTQGLVLGFAGFNEQVIDEGVRTLARIIKSLIAQNSG
jgi:GntR family transcriptional regulator / MocR family aminotransferase